MVASAMGSGGHINPAVSIYASFGGKDHVFGLYGELYNSAWQLVYIPFQIIGAIIGQLTLDFLYWRFIKETSEQDKFATRGCHGTNPAIQEKNYIRNFGFEFIMTGLLLTIIFCTSHNVAEFLIGDTFTTVMFVALSFLGITAGLGAATGFALNPARDLGPRIVYQLLKSKMGTEMPSANWKYSWVPVATPISIGLIFGLISLAF